jgi:M6 family metalloprotease-like protein
MLNPEKLTLNRPGRASVARCVTPKGRACRIYRKDNPMKSWMASFCRRLSTPSEVLERARLASLALMLILAAFAGHVSLAKEAGANPSMPSSSSEQSVEGVLTIVWGDSRPGVGVGGETRYALALPDGRVLPLQLQGQDSTAVLDFGKHVIVTGRVLPGAMPNALDPAPILVDTITARDTGLTTDAAVIGSRKVIYLLVKFSDDAAVPHPPIFYTDLNNPDTAPMGEVFPATVNGFFKKTSWNQFSWVGDVGGLGGVGASGGWLTLPHPKTYYAPCGWSGSCAGANLSLIGDDATALGRAQGITFTNYDNINFVLSNDLDCCAWGGGYYSTVDSKFYGSTWEPPWGQETGTYAHEMGHSIGLPHSGWVYYAYDSPWDTMSNRVSANTIECGSYVSDNDSGATDKVYCTEPGDGYIAAHKDYLGWIPSANSVVTDTSSSTTLTLEGSALPLTSAIKMIKICIAGLSCTGSNAHYFTVEARVKALGTPSQFDNAIPGEGVIIHSVQLDRAPIGGMCFFNSQSGWAVPIDSTPGDYDSVNCNFGGRVFPNFGLYNAQWTPGQTYTNGFSVGVVSRTGSTFLVSLTGKAPPAITGINPAGGDPAGGTNVTITGASFVTGSTVALGGVAATNVIVVNDTTITATTGAHAAGTVSVVVTNPLGQSATFANGFTFTTAPLITAAATSATSVLISWNTVPSASSYQVFRSSGSGFSLINTVAGLTYSDSTVSSNTAYLYKVRSVVSGVPSPDSNIDLATTVIFTNDPLGAGTTTIKGIHLTEMRTAVNAVHVLAGLGTATWTDPSPVGVRIKAVHITELRSALNAARSSLLLPPQSYQRAVTTGTSPVAATDFTEIRNGTK